MVLLEGIAGSADVRSLGPGQLGPLAQELREFPVRTVGATGGHLGSNLRVVTAVMPGQIGLQPFAEPDDEPRLLGQWVRG